MIKEILYVDFIASAKGSVSVIMKNIDELKDDGITNLLINVIPSAGQKSLDKIIEKFRNYFEDIKSTQEIRQFITTHPSLKSIRLSSYETHVMYDIWQK